MLGLGTKHLVEDGKVFCALRHADVTVERCLSCTSLRAISREAAPDGSEVRVVRCDPPAQLLTS